MGAERLVEGVVGPALAIDDRGRVVAVNGAASEFLGRPARNLVGQDCSDIVLALDAGGERVCHPDRCPTLASLSGGHATDLPWCSWPQPNGTHLPISATALALPVETRTDSTAAVILLHVAPPEREAADLDPGAGDIQVRLFGSPECLVNGRRVQLPRRRALEVLALLAFAPDGGLRKEQICDALWTEPPGGSERTHLRVLLHSLRQTLGPDITVNSPHGTERLQLAQSLWVDAIAFVRGLSALLRTRPLLSGLDVPARLEEVDALLSLYVGDLDEAGYFGAWVVPHRERLRAGYLALLREATQLAAESRDPVRAMAYCHRAVAADPLQEDFQIALIAAYGELGRRRDALAQYQSYRSALAADLAIQPSAAIERALGLALKAS